MIPVGTPRTLVSTGAFGSFPLLMVVVHDQLLTLVSMFCVHVLCPCSVLVRVTSVPTRPVTPISGNEAIERVSPLRVRSLKKSKEVYTARTRT